MAGEAVITEDVEKIIKNYNPDKVILFGSRASENYSEDSDYDLLIIKETSTRRINRREEATDGIYLNAPVDLLILTPEEIHLLKQNDSEFLQEILEKGIVLYEKG